MESANWKVFISYKRKTGQDFAVHLREGLEAEKIPAFLDIVDIPKKFEGKTEWWRYRDEAISLSGVFLLIITDGIETSDEIKKEFSYAREKSKEFAFFRHKGLKAEIRLDLPETKVNLADYNQIEFETKEDLLRQALRVLRDTSRTDAFQKRAIQLSPSDFAKPEKVGGLFRKLLSKAVSTEEILGKLEDFEVDFLRGNWFLSKGNNEKALILYDRALALKPDFVPCLIRKGVALDQLGRKEEAIISFDKSIAVEPTALGFALKGTALLMQKRYHQAISCYDASIKIRPLPFTYYNKAFALGKLGREDDAIVCYNEALRVYPKDADCWWGKAFSLFKIEKYQESIECCNKTFELKPSSSLSLGLKGLNLMCLRKLKEANECFDEALKVETTSLTLVLISELSLIQGRIKEGLETAERAFSLSTHPWVRIAAWFLRISALYFSGKDKEAQREEEQLINYWKLEKDIVISGKPLSLLIPVINERLEGEIRSKLLSFVSVLAKEEA